MEERRKLERFELITPAHVLIESAIHRREKYDLRTRDISSAGAFLISSQPIAEGTDVRMEFVLSLDMLQKLSGEKGRARVRVKGKVIRSDPDGIAIQFDSNYKITALGIDSLISGLL